MNLGTDIKSDFSFSNGDLNVVFDINNLIQALSNRLNTYLNDLSLFYINYGSTIVDELGELNNPRIHEYIIIELNSRVLQDERIKYCNTEFVNKTQNSAEFKVNATLLNEENVNFDLIISKDNKVEITVW